MGSPTCRKASPSGLPKQIHLLLGLNTPAAYQQSTTKKRLYIKRVRALRMSDMATVLIIKQFSDSNNPFNNYLESNEAVKPCSLKTTWQEQCKSIVSKIRLPRRPVDGLLAKTSNEISLEN